MVAFFSHSHQIRVKQRYMNFESSQTMSTMIKTELTICGNFLTEPGNSYNKFMEFLVQLKCFSVAKCIVDFVFLIKPQY